MEFSLNQAQERAVLTADGPVLIVAGAGSGKTMVLAHRIAHLIEKGVKADQILAITFTNKAAEEMRNRINSLIPNSQFPIPKPWVGTFHSFSAFVLRQSGRAIGVGKTFSIVDEEDSLALVKEALADLELDPKKFEPRKLRALISRKKNEMEGRENFNQSYFEKILVRVWEKYEEKLEKAKALDFDDLLLKT